MHSQHKNLIEKIKEVLPKERQGYDFGIQDPAYAEQEGYNQAIQDCISSLPQVMSITLKEICKFPKVQPPQDPSWYIKESSIITLLSEKESKK